MNIGCSVGGPFYSRGQYYLQNSQVSFQSGGIWTARNVQPLVGIVEIDFVFVDNAGSGVFATKVINNDFGAFIQRIISILRGGITLG